MFRFNIRLKSLLLFLAIALIPLLAVSLFWLKTEQINLRSAAEDRQKLILNQAVREIDLYIRESVQSLEILGENSSIIQLNLPNASKELGLFISQDNEINRIALMNSIGQESVAFDQVGLIYQPNSPQAQEAYRTVVSTHKQFISTVHYDKGTPYITIAIPLLAQSTDSKTVLNIESQGILEQEKSINGVLVSDVELSKLGNSELAEDLGDGGYVYLVDSSGMLIAHPDISLLRAKPNLSKVDEVQLFTASTRNSAADDVEVGVRQTISEKNVQVLSSHKSISQANWAVVAQEPIDSVYAGVNAIKMLALLSFLVVGIVVTIMSFIFSNNLATPIKQLVEGAQKIGAGDLLYRFNFKGNDEIGLLARTFNAMALSLSQLVRGVEVERNKLAVVLDSSVEAVIAINDQHLIVHCNAAAARLANTTQQKLNNTPLSNSFSWLKNEHPFHIDYDKPELHYDQLSYLSPNKQIHYIDLVFANINDDPTGISCIITIHDHTEERLLETMKVDFVSMTAHELRTPITIIDGCIGLMIADKDNKLSEEKKKEFLQMIQTKNTELSNLVGDIMNAASIEHHTLKLQMEELDWIQLIRGAVQDQGIEAKAKSISITINSEVDTISMNGDKLSLSRVVNNLISNAIRFSPDHSSISVEVKVTKKDIITQVHDHGIGIPAEAIPNLFTKFYRVKGGLLMGEEGTGLGLYISKSIVTMHHGNIWVESKPGEGSTFSFSIPTRKINS